MAYSKYLTLTLLMLSFMMTSCTSVQKPPGLLSGETFNGSTAHPRIFFYANYLNTADRPGWDETFMLRVDNVSAGDIDANEFVEVELPPGIHTFEVNEIAWNGYIRSHSSVTTTIDTIKPNFIVEDVLPNDKAVLSRVSTARGQNDVATRIEKCTCGTSLGRYLKTF